MKSPDDGIPALPLGPPCRLMKRNRSARWSPQPADCEGQGIHPLAYVMFPRKGILTRHKQCVAADPSQYVLPRSFVNGLNRTRNRKGEAVLQRQNPICLPAASKLIQQGVRIENSPMLSLLNSTWESFLLLPKLLSENLFGQPIKSSRRSEMPSATEHDGVH